MKSFNQTSENVSLRKEHCKDIDKIHFINFKGTLIRTIASISFTVVSGYLFNFEIFLITSLEAVRLWH
ncbi:hypothetical protein SAMN00777080_5082 [Aquiflexum balticum DSM 16537]|uniref:Uncharacterized protein n=1 Tax=Aquiflexum balticum DSM 16537 TaxID=758820 RepID=A0A1W2HBY5_9BACT|nr:hypothetical protein [Aquiflexum balticum]SMD46393.1 hypothetical protein SAMN00777080_5082 [Aquiflexum balticum DSM 16537]